ncbi:MAG: efflux RND transporter periplasmic adaptor subunit [Thermodesulfobacteriota bacterium]
MKKRALLTVIALLVVIGILAGVKTLQIRKLLAQKDAMAPPPEVVTTFTARQESWETALGAVGSLTAVQGIEVTTELPGKVIRIAFAPGSRVKAGDLLLEQDTATEQAQLRAAESAASLARLTLDRYRTLLEKDSIAKAVFDNADAQYRQAVAQADALKAIIARKTIRAPFSGRLGVRMVSLGQFLKEGTPVVSLQAMDPLYVNFLLPQQELARLRVGLTVRVSSDSAPGLALNGTLSAVNPDVDAATRNVRAQATVANPDEILRPGMFVNLSLVLPDREQVVVIPATAVSYAPYGDSVFLVEEKKDEKIGASGLVVRQQFVRLGARQGDLVAVTSGLAPGQTVVSTGVFKLRNGQAVVLDNRLAPEFTANPKPANE